MGKLSRVGQYSSFHVFCDHPSMRMNSVYDTPYSSLRVRLRIFSTKNIGQMVLKKYACKIRVREDRQLAESGVQAKIGGLI